MAETVAKSQVSATYAGASTGLSWASAGLLGFVQDFVGVGRTINTKVAGVGGGLYKYPALLVGILEYLGSSVALALSPFYVAALYFLTQYVAGPLSLVFAPLISLEANQRLADAVSGRLGAVLCCGRRAPQLLVLKPVVRVAFFALLFVSRILVSFIRYIVPLLFAVIFTMIFLFFEAYTSLWISTVAVHYGLVATTYNVGVNVGNTIFDVADITMPAINANAQMSVQSSLAVYNFIQGQSNAATGRRLQPGLDLSQVEDSLGGIIGASALLTVAINKVEIAFMIILLELIYPILAFLLDFITFAASRLYCFIIGTNSNVCSIREVLQDTIGTVLNAFICGLTSVLEVFGATPECHVIDFACNQAELGQSNPSVLSGGVPCDCTNTGGFLSIDYYGMYSKGCPVTTARLLCEVGAAGACEYLDGARVACGQGALDGCPMTRRALTAAGHLFNVEVLERDSYEICVNSTSLFKAGRGSWEHLGSCGVQEESPNARRHLEETFGTVPVLKDLAPRRVLDQKKPKTQSEQVAGLKQVVAQHDFSASGRVCDLSRKSNDPFEQHAALGCINEAVIVRNLRHTKGGYGRSARSGRRLQEPPAAHSWSAKTLEFWSGVHETAKFVRRRAEVYAELEGHPRRLQETLALTPATKNYQGLRALRSAVASLEAVSRMPSHVQEVVRRRRERRLERRGLDSILNCPDPTETYCCTGQCVPAGQACPNLTPSNTYQQWICAIQSAQASVDSFDETSAFDSFVDCWNSYGSSQETDPFGPYADTSSSLVYCFPMRRNVGYRLSAVNPNIYTWVQQSCTNSTGLLSATCTCPMYWNAEFDYDHLWFAFVALNEPARIVNFFIVLQLIVSGLLTGEGRIFSFIGYSWYGFWSWFGLPTWWTYMFLLRYDFTSWPQEELCAVLHLGSFCYGILCYILILIFVDALWPLYFEIMKLFNVVPRAYNLELLKVTDPVQYRLAQLDERLEKLEEKKTQ